MLCAFCVPSFPQLMVKLEFHLSETQPARPPRALWATSLLLFQNHSSAKPTPPRITAVRVFTAYSGGLPAPAAGTRLAAGWAMSWAAGWAATAAFTAASIAACCACCAWASAADTDACTAASICAFTRA